MLGNPETISLVQTLLISLCGICIVFLCLACLILAIRIMGFIFVKMGSGTRTEQMGQNSQGNVRQDGDDIYALLFCAVSSAANIPLNKMKVKSIQEKI